ncbi:MAG: hypothetical protein ACI3YZ_04905 [Prevotella sp.]
MTEPLAAAKLQIKIERTKKKGGKLAVSLPIIILFFIEAIVYFSDGSSFSIIHHVMKKTKVEKHLSLSPLLFNILIINLLVSRNGDRHVENGANAASLTGFLIITLVKKLPFFLHLCCFCCIFAGKKIYNVWIIKN